MMKRTFLFRVLPLLLGVLFLCACSKKTDDDGVPEGCLRAGNDAVDYTFCYAEDWELDRNDGMIAIKRNVAGGASIAYASISVQVFTLSDSGMGANNYWEQYREDLEELYGDRINFTSEKEECRLGGVIANRNTYTLAFSDTVYSFEQVLCVRNGAVYILTLTAPETGFDTAHPCFDTVISTFAFA